MLGGIAAGVLMIAPFVSLLAAAVILVGMVTLAVAGAVESRKEKRASSITLGVPSVEKAA